MALGEFDRIARFFAPLSRGAPGAFGLGDDAAELPSPAPGSAWIVTTDAMVEGVHFLPADPPDLVARKALRVNLSDLAAMGARPTGYTLSLALPATLDAAEAWLTGFADGLGADQDEYGIDLYGGDSVSTPGPVWMSITAFGQAPQGGALRRSGARPGDQLWITGTVGDAALGLRVLTGDLRPDSDDGAYLVDRYRLPRPRVSAGPALLGVATAALDVSDGLVQDAGHIAAQSGVSIRIDAADVPLSAAARVAVDSDPALRHHVLSGGDDYELLFTAPPGTTARIEEIANAAGTAMTRIGVVAAGEGVQVRSPDGGTMDGLGSGGWRHY